MAHPQHTGHAKMENRHFSRPFELDVKNLAYSEYFECAVPLYMDGVPLTISSRGFDNTAFYLDTLGNI